MEIPFIGREKEKEILQEALQSPEAEMVAVVGRRRVGKSPKFTPTSLRKYSFSAGLSTTMVSGV